MCAQLELLYETFHEVLEAHALLCNASRKNIIVKISLVNISNLYSQIKNKMSPKGWNKKLFIRIHYRQAIQK